MISRERLHHRNRIGVNLMKKRIEHGMYNWGDYIQSDDFLYDRGFYGNTKHPCSCIGCGNPRRNFHGKEKLSIQERRALDSFEYQLYDLYSEE